MLHKYMHFNFNFLTQQELSTAFYRCLYFRVSRNLWKRLTMVVAVAVMSRFWYRFYMMYTLVTCPQGTV